MHLEKGKLRDGVKGEPGRGDRENGRRETGDGEKGRRGDAPSPFLPVYPFPACRLLRCGHVGFADIEVCRDLLHVVVILERLHQFQHLASVLALELDVVLRHH